MKETSTFYDGIDVYNEHGIKVPGVRKCKHIRESGRECGNMIFKKDVNGRIVCVDCGGVVEDE